MTEIPNYRYITVKRDEKGEIVVFVGGKPATTYQGKEIWNIEYVKGTFAWMQERNPEIEEWHIGAFATEGEYAEVGNPSGKFGPNGWCRVKKKGSSSAPWVFLNAYRSADGCAYFCASDCARYIQADPGFRRALLGPKIDKAKNNNAQHKTVKVDIPVMKPGDEHVVQLPGQDIQYRIIAEKLQNTL